MEWYQHQNQDSKYTSPIDDLHDVYKVYHLLININPPLLKKENFNVAQKKIHQRYSF